MQFAEIHEHLTGQGFQRDLILCLRCGAFAVALQAEPGNVRAVGPGDTHVVECPVQARWLRLRSYLASECREQFRECYWLGDPSRCV